VAAIHHYVPQFLLKNFCSTDPKIWAYDKETDKSFETNIHNVGGGRNFYETKIGDEIVSLEEGLGDMEAKTGDIIDRILNERSIGGLTGDDKQQIAFFVAVQMRRGPNQRAHLTSLSEQVKKVLDDRFGPGLMKSYTEMTADAAKVHSIASLTEPNPFTELILNKSWLLFETSAAVPLYISDNPVALQNNTQPRNAFEGNLGLAVQGIEIYLPISGTVALGFYCPSHEALIRDTMEKLRARTVQEPHLPTLGFGDLLDWTRAFRKGISLHLAPDHVLNQNSLQVRQAERFVYSSLPDFSVVKKMIADDPRYRIGPRPQVS
jgi:hypothetical protein